MNRKTVCIAGKNDIAVNVLLYLKSIQNNDFELVVTCNRNEDGKNGWQKSLRFFAERLGIKEVGLEDLYETSDLIFLSMEYDRIIRPQKFLSNQLYNIHFSALPKYKGMYTSALPILHDEAEGGVTFHRIASGIDTGEIIAQKLFPLEEEDTSRDLYLKCISFGTELVISQLADVLKNICLSVPQPAVHSTYFSKAAIDYGNLAVNLNDTAYGIGRQIRAFTFREYQLLKVHGHKIFDYEITCDLSTEKPGTILKEEDGVMTIATIDYNMILYMDKFESILSACKEGDLTYLKTVPSLKKYLEEKNEKGWTPLIVAVYNNQKEVVDYLLEQGADFSVKNHNGTNLLMYAKNTYLDHGDDTLLKKMYSLGILPEEEDHMGLNLYYYIDNIEEPKKQNILAVFGK